jgi:hypothetical protein
MRKCDWSTLKLQQWNERNYYKWYVSGKVLDDTCVDYMFMVYDFQTKKTDTVYDVRGIVEVQFNVKGKYKLYLKVWNRCLISVIQLCIVQSKSFSFQMLG